MEEKLKRAIFMVSVSRFFYETKCDRLGQLLEEYNAGSPPQVRFLNSELCRLAKQEEKFYNFMQTFPGPIPSSLDDAKFLHDILVGDLDF